MSKGEYFTFKTEADLSARAQALGLEDELSLSKAHAGVMQGPVQAGPFTLANRFALHPMEGWDGDAATGKLTDDVFRRWERMGQSGAALIWGVEALAIDFPYRANPNQLVILPENTSSLAEGLRRMRQAHAQVYGASSRMVVGAQITCSGRYSFGRPKGSPLLLVHHHPILDRRVGADASTPLATDSELEDLVGFYARSAKVAKEAGFDFIDIKSCHGYWLNETLAARTRPGKYGGSFENRTRLFSMIVDAVQRELGKDLPLGTRMSASDGLPYEKGQPGVFEGPYVWGWGVDEKDPETPDLSEPIRLMALLKAKGLRLFNLSAASPYCNPHFSRPTETPPVDGAAPTRDPLVEVARHLRLARDLKQADAELCIVGTGYSYLRQFKLAVAENAVGRGWTDLVGLGRAFLSYPDEVARLLESGQAKQGPGRIICTGDSSCTTGPRLGLKSGCIFDPYYKEVIQEIRRKQAQAA